MYERMKGTEADVTDEPVVLLVGGELMARARLQNATADRGMRVKSVLPDGLVDGLQEMRPKMVVLDLDTGRDRVLDELARARAAGLAPARVLGYFSHVEQELGEAARAAGCEAYPRGRFWRDLHALLASA